LLGQSYRGGVQYAVSQINARGGIDGRRIDVVTADGGDNNTQWVNSMNVLAAEKPVLIIGHPHSSALLAQSEMIKRVGVPYFFSGGSVALTQEKLDNRWIFRVSPNDGISAAVAMDYIVDELKFTKIGVLHDNTAYGIDGAAVMEETLKKRGLTLAAKESHELFASDVSAQLLKLRAAGAQIIVGWSIPVVTATTLRQVKELKLGVPYMGGRSMALSAVLGLTTSAQMDGAYGAVDSAIAADPKATAWVNNYKRFAGKDPDFFTAQYHDLVYMIRDWILQAGVKPEPLRKAILQTSNRKGVGSNVYSYNRITGESNFSAQIVLYEGDTVKVLKTVTVKP
jgi:branched-chain amino acid transport system substrate-binding protein